MPSRIMRFRYRVGDNPAREVIATEKICEKRKKALIEEHGDNIKISRIVSAADHPFGAPHV